MYLNSVCSLIIFIISTHNSKITFWNIVFIYNYPIEMVLIVINGYEGDKIMIINDHSYFFRAKLIDSNEL